MTRIHQLKIIPGCKVRFLIRTIVLEMKIFELLIRGCRLSPVFVEKSGLLVTVRDLYVFVLLNVPYTSKKKLGRHLAQNLKKRRLKICIFWGYQIESFLDPEKLQLR